MLQLLSAALSSSHFSSALMWGLHRQKFLQDYYLLSCHSPMPEAPHDPSAFLTSVSAGLFHLFFLTVLCLPSILTFLKHIISDAPSAQLRGSTVPCGGSVGTRQNCLEPTVSNMGQPRPLLSEATLQILLPALGHQNPIHVYTCNPSAPLFLPLHCECRLTPHQKKTHIALMLNFVECIS